jgi:cbb3-type cytochrome oxidase subunit 3
MYKAFYAGMEQTLPLLAFLFFVGVFVLVAVRVFALRKSSDFSHDERLPLSDDEVTR